MMRWVLRRRKHHYERGHRWRYLCFEEIAAWTGHDPVWEDG